MRAQGGAVKVRTGLELVGVTRNERGLVVEHLAHGAMFEAANGKRRPLPFRSRSEVRFVGKRIEVWTLWPTGMWKRMATARVLRDRSLSVDAGRWHEGLHRWIVEQALAARDLQVSS